MLLIGVWCQFLLGKFACCVLFSTWPIHAVSRDLFHQFSYIPERLHHLSVFRLSESNSHKDWEGGTAPYRHTLTVLLNVQRRRSDDTCDLVDATVAKQPSQNSMPTVHCSATLIKLWLCLLSCKASRAWKLCVMLCTIQCQSPANLLKGLYT